MWVLWCVYRPLQAKSTGWSREPEGGVCSNGSRCNGKVFFPVNLNRFQTLGLATQLLLHDALLRMGKGGRQ